MGTLQMAKPAEIHEIQAASVCCTGPDEAPHEPLRLELPPMVTMPCPMCGRKFRRVSGGNRLSAAAWPRANRHD